MTHQQLKDTLIDLHEDAYRWAIQCCGHDSEEALDVLQQCYAKVLCGDAVFNGQSSVKTWFFGVIRNTAWTQLRTQRRRVAILKKWWSQRTTSPGVESPEAEHDINQRAQAIRRLLDTLSAKQRQTLELVFYHDLTIQEAAHVMEMPVGTVRTHYARGKKRLTQLLDAEPQALEVSL